MSVQYRTYAAALLHGGPLVAAAWVDAFGSREQPKMTEPARRRKRDAWKDAEIVVGGKRPAEFRSKLEWDFWGLLWLAYEAGEFTAVDYESDSFPAIGVGIYTPDFATTTKDGVRAMWETKGYLWRHDRFRIVAAAEKTPGVAWVLVTRARHRGVWMCRQVTAKGIQPDVWCPSWLSGARAM